MEQANGVVGALVFDVALDEDVPRDQVGVANEVEDGAGVGEAVDLGVGVEGQEARSDGRVVESAGPEGESVGAFDVMLGFAGLEEGREREGLRRRGRGRREWVVEGLGRCELKHLNGVRIGEG